MTTSRNRTLFSTSSALVIGAGVAFASPAAAQDGETAGQSRSPVLGEIIVTARKREESLLEIPFAVSAFTEEDLENANLNDFTDLDDFTPGFSFENANANRADRGTPNIVIRGLNLTSFSGSSDAALLFLDGAPVQGGEVGTFLDVQRVEVLRGPQSAYFGRNTFSGAVNLITADPGDVFSGKVSGEYGRYGTHVVEGMLEGPIAPGLLNFRIAAGFNEKGGHYVNNSNGKREVGDEKTVSFVGTLLFTPVDAVRLKLRGSRVRIDDGPNPAFRFPGVANCDPDGNGSVTWRCGTPPDTGLAEELVGFQNRFLPGYGEPDLYPNEGGVRAQLIEPFSLYSPDSPFYVGGKPFVNKMGLAKEIDDLSAALSVDLPSDITFDWLTAWNRTRTSGVSDENMLPRGVYVPGTDTPAPALVDTFLVERYSKNTSHEARLSSGSDQRFRWTIGANLIKGENISSHVVGRFFAPTVFSTRPILETDTFGIFGGVYLDLTDRFTVSGELRYQEDKVEVPSGGLKDTFKDWGPRITLEYAASDEVNVFVNWSQGFRPGSFNSSFTTLTEAQIQQIVDQTGAGISIDPETIEQFEGGVKGRFLDGRLSGSLVGYFGKITDQQVQSVATIDLDNGGTTVIGVTANLGEVELYGIEMEAALQATDQFVLQTTFGWNHTEYTEGVCLTCVSQGAMEAPEDVIGKRLPGAPQFGGSLVGTFTAPVSNTLDGFIRGETIFEGSKWATPANLYKTGSRVRANLRLGVQNDTYRIEGYVTNIFNDDTPDYVNRATDLDNFGNAFQIALPDKRAYGVRISANF